MSGGSICVKERNSVQWWVMIMTWLCLCTGGISAVENTEFIKTIGKQQVSQKDIKSVYL